MKPILLFFAFVLPQLGQSQCSLLYRISDTIEFEGISIVYFQQDSMVGIQYTNDRHTRTFPRKHYMDCTTRYMPSVWRPVWKNDRYIAFGSGGGTYVSLELLAPLDTIAPFQESSGWLFDTLNTSYFSLYRDRTDRSPHLRITNFSKGTEQTFQLKSDLFWGAILYERLNYTGSYPNGFDYKNGVLTLYVNGDNETLIPVPFTIEKTE